jgi:hypothetical protein
MQTTSQLLMIRPTQFTFNAQTALTNAFQSTQDKNAQEAALNEFNNLVNLLMQNDVNVMVINDTEQPHTPDSIFPNNWISFHHTGCMVLYPMYAPNRRQERKPHVIETLKTKFKITDQIDLTFYEDQNLFLEGTGSMVLDRENKIAYACLSQRTDLTILKDVSSKLGYTPLPFTATDATGYPIYHTNVMMCVADRFVVICLESIKNNEEREAVVAVIQKSGKEIIDITLDQMNRFAGNMLQVENNEGKKLMVMSSQAYHSLTEQQLSTIAQCNFILHVDLRTIERNGGGSARCMMTEVFLPCL